MRDLEIFIFWIHNKILIKYHFDYKIKTEIYTRRLVPWEGMVGRKKEESAEDDNEEDGNEEDDNEEDDNEEDDNEEDDNVEDDEENVDSSIWLKLSPSVCPLVACTVH